MADVDYGLYEDTKQNLIAAAQGDPELEELVWDQLEDMKECGYFDLPEMHDYAPTDEEDDY